jgi:hypothetical protein
MTDGVKIPESEDEAALMCLLGSKWLEDHAPHRLRQTYVDEHNRTRQAERERCAEIVQMARCADIDQDWRTVIHFIEGGMSIDQIKKVCEAFPMIYAVQVFLLSGAVVHLNFRNKDAGMDAYSAIRQTSEPNVTAEVIDIQDDFGSLFHAEPSEVSGAMFIDETELAEAAILRGLLQARTQKLAQTRAAADPSLNGGVVPAQTIVMPGQRRN